MATAAASVKTVQFVDPRIEPQPDPVYQYVIGPVQNQFYKIGKSSLGESSLTFNNLTTLGIDRAYLDTFELELTAEIKFTVNSSIEQGGEGTVPKTPVGQEMLIPSPDEWTFQSFPFNTCCDEARVNINGGAFFSQPLSYVRAKERYMNQKALSDCYANVCPVHRPILQTESGRDYTSNASADADWLPANSIHNFVPSANGPSLPTRLGAGMFNFMQSEEGLKGCWNNAILRLGSKVTEDNTYGYENYKIVAKGDGTYETIVKVKWREPLFVSPFSSRYDATYGRPLYNITSMDFAFTMMKLGNMIRLCNLHHTSHTFRTTAGADAEDDGFTHYYVTGYDVKLTDAQLCYQVMTIPKTVKKPLTTLVPYRRFVPYITSIENANTNIRSGTYTFNEIPTAIWVFIAPEKTQYQENNGLSVGTDVSTGYVGNWDNNKLFAYIKKLSITLANTTQILATAEPHDLYRIAKANGCEDSYWSWCGNDTCMPKLMDGGGAYTSSGAGSVLRLKPGIDIIVPDAALIPGSNANNMVLQVIIDEFVRPREIPATMKYALWLIFEYVGVAAITPGQCEISMNPVGGGQVMGVSPIVSATNENNLGSLDGSGFWDSQNKRIAIQRHIGDDGIISRIMNLPSGKQAADWAEAHGAAKRPRGGAVIGRGGLSDWV